MNKKIGMYTTDEILEYMTDCEGAFLGRSMYDAIFGKIDKLQQKNKQLKQQLKDKDEKISKVIEYCNEKLKWNRDDGNDYWAGKNNAQQQVSSDIKDILESNKED